MNTRRYDVALTTIADGSVTAYTPLVSGRVVAVLYKKTDFADGVGAVVSTELSGKTLLTTTNMNASATYMPRLPVQDEAGADATLDGTRKMREPLVVSDERLKIVIASGGNIKTGTLSIIMG